MRLYDEEMKVPLLCRFDERTSAEEKLAFSLPSDEEKKAKPTTGARRAG